MRLGILAPLWLLTAVSATRAQSVNGPGDDILCSGYTPVQLRPASAVASNPNRTFFQPTLSPAVTGKPWSARDVTQDLQVRSDGTRLCGVPNVSLWYRDSAGRTRSESGFFLRGADGKPAPAAVRIVDPSQPIQVEYDLDMLSHIAYRLYPQKPQPPPTLSRGFPEPARPSLQSKKEDLGIHSFQGVDVEGTLTTTTGIPLESSVPISVTTEIWIWPYLRQAVLQKTVTPSSSRTEARLNLSTAEPDPALFRVPEGWKIVDGVIRVNEGGGGTRRVDAGFEYTARIPPPARSDRVVHEAPYSAEQISESVTNLALPPRTPFRNSVKFYRDSSGRTRIERPLSVMPEDTTPPPMLPEINDPVDEVRIILDPVHRIAHRFAWTGVGTNPPQQVASVSSMPHSTMSEKDLGESTIEGMKVTGTLQTFRTPAGANGNDHDVTETSESWFSTALRVLVLTKQNLATTSSTVRLTNISTTEPDPKLFEIPDGYTVVDEKAPVTITITQP